LLVIALTAVNLDPKYLSCVPHYIDFWLSLNGRRSETKYLPKVLVIADTLPPELEKQSQFCEVIQPMGGVSSVFVSQAIRVYYPGLLDADYVITSDVDMLPLDDVVFQRALEEIDGGDEFVVCRDVLEEGQLPICYNIASPATWEVITGISHISQLANQLSNDFRTLIDSHGYSGAHGGNGWFADQIKLFKLVSRFEVTGGVVVKLQDAETGHKRLDRIGHVFPLNWLTLPAVFLGRFTDYHVHHPIARYSRFTKWLLVTKKLGDYCRALISPRP
jgi:hypothetical protein